MSFTIAAVGTALPEHRMSQADATLLAQQVVSQTDLQARFLEVLYRNAGVDYRFTAVPHRRALEYLSTSGETDRSEGNGHAGAPALAEPAVAGSLGPTTAERMSLYQEHAAPLATLAASRALRLAAVPPGDITHVITVSCTGFAAPGVDIELIQGLGLRPTAERIHVGFMGCHGAINGLRVARAIAGSDERARILLCAVELCTLHYRFQWDPERCLGNALFADGAAAIVGGGQALSGDWSVKATGSCLLPDSADAMTWRIGDHGFEMTLSRRVPELIGTHLRPWMVEWLGTHGLRLEDVASWAIHPGGPRILSAAEASLGLAPQATEVSRRVLAGHGNMSSPTVLFILDELRRSARCALA